MKPKQITESEAVEGFDPRRGSIPGFKQTSQEERNEEPVHGVKIDGMTCGCPRSPSGTRHRQSGADGGKRAMAVGYQPAASRPRERQKMMRDVGRRQCHVCRGGKMWVLDKQD